MLLLIAISFSVFITSKLMDNVKYEMTKHLDYSKKHFVSQLDFENHINAAFYKELSGNQITIFSEFDAKQHTLGFTNREKLKDDDVVEHLTLTHYDKSKKLYYEITRNITYEKNLMQSVYSMMFGIILFGIIIIIFYTNHLSKKLMSPLQKLTNRFSTMHENLLHKIKIEELPTEFISLADSMNLLITKVQTSINYRKELYIGTAHELKTPLAVMRLKNQITLMKYKKQDKIKEALNQNIESIDTLNAMIHNILEYGRAEGAQFEQPQRLNLINLMISKCEEYELLAHSQDRNFIYHFSIAEFRINVQPLLFMQIFQNFIQNALKFTPKGGLVSLNTRMDLNNFIIEIEDEGEGIDETKDFFAPFKRSVESTGAGLGLFLAQNAAESMGVVISLKNRPNKNGAIASISFPLNRFLLKD